MKRRIDLSKISHGGLYKLTNEFSRIDKNYSESYASLANTAKKADDVMVLDEYKNHTYYINIDMEFFNSQTNLNETIPLKTKQLISIIEDNGDYHEDYPTRYETVNGKHTELEISDFLYLSPNLASYGEDTEFVVFQKHNYGSWQDYHFVDLETKELKTTDVDCSILWRYINDNVYTIETKVAIVMMFINNFQDPQNPFSEYRYEYDAQYDELLMAFALKYVRDTPESINDLKYIMGENKINDLRKRLRVTKINEINS